MGGDSAGIAGPGELTNRADEKVFYNGDFLLGFAGSFRLGQVLRHCFEPPRVPPQTHGIALERFMVKTFIDSLRNCLKLAGVASIDNGVESTDSSGSGILVGFRDHLWQIDSDYQVGSSREQLYSIGIGAGPARGALKALNLAQPKWAPEKRLHEALQIAEGFSGGVCAPFTILSTPHC
jgi:hypothetical protein